MEVASARGQRGGEQKTISSGRKRNGWMHGCMDGFEGRQVGERGLATTVDDMILRQCKREGRAQKTAAAGALTRPRFLQERRCSRHRHRRHRHRPTPLNLHALPPATPSSLNLSPRAQAPRWTFTQLKLRIHAHSGGERGTVSTTADRDRERSISASTCGPAVRCLLCSPACAAQYAAAAMTFYWRVFELQTLAHR